jgi:SAM-dependent methyltransferase
MAASEEKTSDHPIRRLSLQTAESPLSTKRVLNTGSGASGVSRLHLAFSGWEEVRLDIDARVQPNLVGSITDMRAIVADASFDAIWSSHNLEHLHSHEVPKALQEFRRVLRPDGFAFVTSPDLEAVAEQLLKHGALAEAYMSPAGPISALDMLYGHRASVAAGNLYMCHNTGFTAATLGQAALEAGFPEARVARGADFDIWGLFLMPQADLGTIAGYLDKTAQRVLLGQ